MIGTVLGHYRVEAELSRGGMGAIYRARHEVIDRVVAVKVLRPELTEDPELVARFITEAKAASAIRHPGIIDILDFGTADDGQAYLVMELLEGESLAQRLAHKRRLDASEAIAITRGIASALTAAHAKGIIHRDLKPDNVFLVPDPDSGERAKVLDFGVAKLLGDVARTEHTLTGVLMGTPLYMAPEQARSAASIDERADLYSLGCILYELLVGEPPFPGQGAGEIITAQMFTPPEAPSTRVDGITPELERVVLRLLEKEPADRYASAAELAEALAGASTSPAARSRSAPSTAANTAVATHSLSPVAVAPRRERDSLPWIVLAIIAAVGMAAGAYYYLSIAGSRPDAPVARPEPTPVPTPPVVPAPVPAPPPVVPVTQTPPPPEPERPARPVRKQHPVTDKGSPIEPSLD